MLPSRAESCRLRLDRGATYLLPKLDREPCEGGPLGYSSGYGFGFSVFYEWMSAYAFADGVKFFCSRVFSLLFLPNVAKGSPTKLFFLTVAVFGSGFGEPNLFLAKADRPFAARFFSTLFPALPPFCDDFC